MLKIMNLFFTNLDRIYVVFVFYYYYYYYYYFQYNFKVFFKFVNFFINIVQVVYFHSFLGNNMYMPGD